MKTLNVVLLLLAFFTSYAQQEYLQGMVITENEKGEFSPLIGANVFWLGTTTGTATDTSGFFNIPYLENKKLVITYIGYEPDTLEIADNEKLTIILKSSTLKEVEITYKKKDTELSFIDPLKIEKISEQELFRAACCNLSESFETNPSVDVSFSDAVTGKKEIKMLGLSGSYTQLTRENIPFLRGLTSGYGLTHIPGPWISSIQLNKGTGSVLNGYESIAGQINVELKKPFEDEKLFLNLYGSQNGRSELNLNLNKKFSEIWSGGLLLHGHVYPIKMDENNDNFVDIPVGYQATALNRWHYRGNKGWRAQAGIQILKEDKQGGQMNFDEEEDFGTTNAYGVGLKTERIEAWSKAGYIFPNKKYKNFGMQLSALHYNFDSYFGLRRYLAEQNSLYSNFIYQSIISNSNHIFKTGGGVVVDNFTETLEMGSFTRTEVVPGTFFEYTYNNVEKFTAVAGIRADHHNIFGLFFTPRLHLRYVPWENAVMRASAGRGQRTPNVFVENLSLFATSRNLRLLTDIGKAAFGFEPEVAWNFGFNITQDFRLDYRDGYVSFDLYHTTFENQVVVDLDYDTRQALFYNLDGGSFSNSFQAEVNYEVIRNLTARFAYRWFDVRTTYLDGLRQKPFTAKHRAFLTTSYEAAKNWQFDYTIQWVGAQRLPSTEENPEPYRLPDNSEDYFIMNAQVSKLMMKEKLELYFGGENLLNFTQKDPIIAADDPFGPYFDSSLIWGPVYGRHLYAGIRFKIK